MTINDIVLLKSQVLGIVFTFFYLVAMIRPLAPIITYYANYDYIATELCENKDKPYLDCNGRCYLNDAMELIDSNPQSEKPVTTLVFNMQDYPFSTLDFCQYKSFETKFKDFSSNPDYQKHFVISDYSSSIFHPPKYSA